MSDVALSRRAGRHDSATPEAKSRDRSLDALGRVREALTTERGIYDEKAELTAYFTLAFSGQLMPLIAFSSSKTQTGAIMTELMSCVDCGKSFEVETEPDIIVALIVCEECMKRYGDEPDTKCMSCGAEIVLGIDENYDDVIYCPNCQISAIES